MKDKYTGCLLGLAVGDALGAAVEFMSLEQIKDTYGDSGIQDFDKWGDFDAGSYTDDTQMAIASALGLILSAKKINKKELWALNSGRTLSRSFGSSGLKMQQPFRDWEKKCPGSFNRGRTAETYFIRIDVETYFLEFGSR